MKKYLLAIYLVSVSGIISADEELVKLTKAVESGSTIAAYHLAQMYFSGNGVTQDTDKAIDLIKKAANAGSGEAQYTLGKLYDEGIGMTQDYTQAYVWYSIAADNWENNYAIENKQYVLSQLNETQLKIANDVINKIKSNMPSINIWKELTGGNGIMQEQNNLNLVIQCAPRTNIYFQYTDGEAPAYFNYALLDRKVDINNSWGAGLRSAAELSEQRLEYEGKVSQLFLELLSAHELTIGIATPSGANVYSFDLNSMAIPFSSLKCSNINWFKSRSIH